MSNEIDESRENELYGGNITSGEHFQRSSSHKRQGVSRMENGLMLMRPLDSRAVHTERVVSYIPQAGRLSAAQTREGALARQSR